MRSISLKLALAFLMVSLVSILSIVILARWNTGTEFRDFIFDQNQQSLVTALSEHYQSYGSWENLEGTGIFPPPPGQYQRFEDRRFPYTLTDPAGKVVLAGPGHHAGDWLKPDQLGAGIPVEVDGQPVGVLIVSRNSLRQDPREEAFIARVTFFFLISAVGTAALALLLGVLLSRTLTRPIRELTEATRDISAGKLGQEVPVRSRDELGELATAFNQMNARLAQSLRLRRQMTADIAHELRTPLSLILGHAEAIHDGVMPATSETVEIIRDEALRLERLVDDLRILSLADAGELPLTLRPVSPTELLRDVQALYRHQAGQKQVSLELEVDTGLPEINVDVERITQVLTNIVDNALRHTPAGGRITLSARQVEGGIELSVADTGPGVPEDELPRLFERLYRTDPARQRQDGGSGLGLSIARSIVEMHGGTIAAENSLGQGLIVRVWLPGNSTD